jgi:hypothetical protein
MQRDGGLMFFSQNWLTNIHLIESRTILESWQQLPKPQEDLFYDA